MRLEDLDTNKIARELAGALEYVHVDYKLDVLENDVIPAWFKAKRGLLEVLSRHPQWDKDTLSIHVDEEYSRISGLDAERAGLPFTAPQPFCLASSNIHIARCSK